MKEIERLIYKEPNIALLPLKNVAPAQIKTLLLKEDLEQKEDNLIFKTLACLSEKVSQDEVIHSSDPHLVLFEKMLNYFQTDEDKLLLLSKTSCHGYNFLHNLTTVNSPLVFQKIISWIPRSQLLIQLTNDDLCEHFIRYLNTLLHIVKKDIPTNIKYSFSKTYYSTPENLHAIFETLPSERDKRLFLKYMLEMKIDVIIEQMNSAEDIALNQQINRDSLSILKTQLLKLCDIKPALLSKRSSTQTLLGWQPQQSSALEEMLYSKIVKANDQPTLRSLCRESLDQIIAQEHISLPTFSCTKWIK